MKKLSLQHIVHSDTADAVNTKSSIQAVISWLFRCQNVKDQNKLLSSLYNLYLCFRFSFLAEINWLYVKLYCSYIIQDYCSCSSKNAMQRHLK